MLVTIMMVLIEIIHLLEVSNKMGILLLEVLIIWSLAPSKAMKLL